MEISVQPAELTDLDSNRALLQSGFWGAFRQCLGWQARAFHCEYREREFDLLVLRRRLPLGVKLAYVPHGPEVEEPVSGREDFLVELAEVLRQQLESCLFLRFDLPWGTVGLGNFPESLDSSGKLHKAPMDIQPPSTVILDLSVGEDRLLAAMKSKTRYNIRLAAKKGVEISVALYQPRGQTEFEATLDEWYRLYQETARRDRITLHSKDYYERLFALAGRYWEGSDALRPAVRRHGAPKPGAPELYLLTARHQGELLAGIIVAVKGEGAWYLYGASSDRKRNLMPSYALQWRAIQLARERGCGFYDLFGIPPSDDPRHQMHGLFRFKTGFGGRVVNRLGCYDVPFRPLLYRLYRGAEQLRSVYYHRWRKRLVGR